MMPINRPVHIVTRQGKAIDGRRVYLAGLKSRLLSVADPATNKVVAEIAVAPGSGATA